MNTLIMIVSILLIAVVLLQSSKAESGNAFTQSGSELFQNRKERGGELFLTRFTFVLGISYFILCLIQMF